MKGPGTILHEWLAMLGFQAEPGCPCLDHMRQMDEWGTQKCRENVEQIIDWLEAEAEIRGGLGSLVFSRSVMAQVLVVVFWRAEHQCSSPEIKPVTRDKGNPAALFGKPQCKHLGGLTAALAGSCCGGKVNARACAVKETCITTTAQLSKLKHTGDKELYASRVCDTCELYEPKSLTG